jgi:WD40 repeat protein
LKYNLTDFTEEFVAHGSNVNCLALGSSSGRVMVTGGEDRKVNMWAIGKPNVIMVRNINLIGILIFYP